MTTYHFTIDTTDYLNFGSNTVAVYYDDNVNRVVEDRDNDKVRIRFICDSDIGKEKICRALEILELNCDKIESIAHFVNEPQDGVPLFVYPYSIADSKDLDKNTELVSVKRIHSKDIDKYYIKTNGLLGFVSATFSDDKNLEDDYHFNIYIHSRFDYNMDSSKDSDKCFNRDFFLHYMLQRVLNINLFDCDPHTKNDNSELGLLLYFFPGLLRRAMNQGLFKQYVHREYNDSRVRGPIDVSRHIVRNMPFCGKIAYSTHEYDYDNPVTQLVRHTIEYLRHHEWASGLLSQSNQTRQDIQVMVANTERYNANERRRVIEQNCRLLHHPFYTEWRPLQHLCLSILRHEDLRFDSAEDEDRIHGILFDGPWLWENYLWWLFNISNHFGFRHPDNKTGKDPIHLFKKDGKGNPPDSDENLVGKEGTTPKYPDFYKPRGDAGQRASEIWDAKFKPYDKKNAINRDDVHQLITYLYIQSTSDNLCKKAGVVFPVGTDDSGRQSYCEKVGTLYGLNGELYKWGLKIPFASESYSGFSESMTMSERLFVVEKQLIWLKSNENRDDNLVKSLEEKRKTLLEAFVNKERPKNSDNQNERRMPQA